MNREYKTKPTKECPIAEVLRLHSAVLRRFIEDQESRNFRTDQDTGANLNALIIWNAVRQLAGLPDLKRSDLPAYCVTCDEYHKDPHQRIERAT